MSCRIIFVNMGAVIHSPEFSLVGEIFPKWPVWASVSPPSWMVESYTFIMVEPNTISTLSENGGHWLSFPLFFFKIPLSWKWSAASASTVIHYLVCRKLGKFMGMEGGVIVVPYLFGQATGRPHSNIVLPFFIVKNPPEKNSGFYPRPQMTIFWIIFFISSFPVVQVWICLE